jgi:hypothetical protein
MENNNHQYFIHYKTGTGGSFIASLIYLTVIERRDIQNFKFLLSKHGNAHNINILLRTIFHEYIDTHNPNQPKYTLMKPKDPGDPFVILDHAQANWNELSTYFPNFKAIKIIYRYDDIKNIVPLIFYKLQIDTYKLDGSLLKMKNIEADLIQHKYYRLSDTSNDRVHNLEFNKIITDKEYTLNFISEVTKKSITEPVSSFYDIWLSRTLNSIEEYNKLNGSTE